MTKRVATAATLLHLTLTALAAKLPDGWLHRSNSQPPALYNPGSHCWANALTQCMLAQPGLVEDLQAHRSRAAHDAPFLDMLSKVARAGDRSWFHSNPVNTFLANLERELTKAEENAWTDSEVEMAQKRRQNLDPSQQESAIELFRQYVPTLERATPLGRGGGDTHRAGGHCDNVRNPAPATLQACIARLDSMPVGHKGMPANRADQLLTHTLVEETFHGRKNPPRESEQSFPHTLVTRSPEWELVRSRSTGRRRNRGDNTRIPLPGLLDEWARAELVGDSRLWRRKSIWQGSPYLTLNVNRGGDGHNGVERDDFELVDVGDRLDIAKYTHVDSPYRDDAKATQYSLRAVLLHSGTERSGHWQALVKKGDWWYFVSDSTRVRTQSWTADEYLKQEGLRSEITGLFYTQDAHWDELSQGITVPTPRGGAASAAARRSASPNTAGADRRSSSSSSSGGLAGKAKAKEAPQAKKQPKIPQAARFLGQKRGKQNEEEPTDWDDEDSDDSDDSDQEENEAMSKKKWQDQNWRTTPEVYWDQEEAGQKNWWQYQNWRPEGKKQQKTEQAASAGFLGQKRGRQNEAMSKKKWWQDHQNWRTPEDEDEEFRLALALSKADQEEEEEKKKVEAEEQARQKQIDYDAALAAKVQAREEQVRRDGLLAAKLAADQF